MKRLAFIFAMLFAWNASADLTHLVEYWNFEAAAANDQTGLKSSYVLTHHGSTTQETQHKGGAHSAGFGASVYFSTADSIFTGTNTHTLACWLYTSSSLPDGDAFWTQWGLSHNIMGLFASGNKWHLVPRRLDDGANNTAADSTVTWSGGSWHFVVHGWDSSTGEIWISVDGETPVAVNNGPLITGPETLESAVAGGSAVTGFIDDMSFFTNRLDLGDIQHLYTNDMATVLGFASTPVTNRTWYLWSGAAASGVGSDQGTNWANAWTNWYSITNVIPGDTIEVSGGTYLRDTNRGITGGLFELPYGTNGAVIHVKHSRESGHNGVADVQVPLGFQSFTVVDGAISDGVESRFFYTNNIYRNVSPTKAIAGPTTNVNNGIFTNCGFFFNGLSMTDAVPVSFAGFHGSAPAGYTANTTIYSNMINWSVIAGSAGPYQQIKFFDPLTAAGSITNAAGFHAYCLVFTNITQWAITMPNQVEGFGQLWIHHCLYQFGRNLSTAGLYSGGFGVDIWSCVLNKWPLAAGGENEDLQMTHWTRVWNNVFYPGGQAMVQQYWDSGSNYNHVYYYGNTLEQFPTNWPWMIEYATNYGATTIQMSTEAQNDTVCPPRIFAEDWRWFNNTAITDPTNGASSIISARNKSWVRQDFIPTQTNLDLYFPPDGLLVFNNIVHGPTNTATLALYNDFPDFAGLMNCTNGCGEGFYMGMSYDTNGVVVDYNIFQRAAYSSNNTLHLFGFSDFTNFVGRIHNRTNQAEFVNLNTTNLSLEPLSGADGGLDLSTFATNMPGLLWDQNGTARGSVNSDGSWSIGALEPPVVVPEGLVLHLTFNDDWGNTNFITDYASGLMNAYQYGITNSTTNCWPTRVANTNRSGFGYGAEFGVLPGVTLPYYTNDLDGYVVGQYAGIPDTSLISNITTMSVCVWARYYAASNNDVANDFNSTMLDGGYAVPGSWVMARHYDVRSSFLIRTNAGLVEGGPEITFPDDTSTGDTTNLNFYVTTVDIPNQVFINYFNGVACSTGAIPANITSVIVSADQPPNWLALGCWTHSGTPAMDIDPVTFGDKYPNNAWFHGIMDEVRIYNRVITPAEVTAIFTGTNPPAAPTISSFTATPSTISSGNSSTLAWSTTGATNLFINQSVGNVTAFNSTNVSPATTKIYTLTAENPSNSVTADVTVTVNPAPSGSPRFLRIKRR